MTIEEIKGKVEFCVCIEAYPVVSAMIDAMVDDGYSADDIYQIVDGMLKKIGY